MGRELTGMVRRGGAATLRDLVDLVLPVTCVACGAPGVTICERCRRGFDLRPRWHRPTPCPPDLPAVTVAGWYAGPLRAAILAMKERHHRSLVGVLADALAVALPPAAVLDGPRSPYAVVAIPTSRRSLRARGEDVLAHVADRAAASRAVSRSSCLHFTRTPIDQAGLNWRQRADNLADSMRAESVPDVPIVIVDDVITTGATVREAARALRAAGAEVQGVAAIAARRRSR